MGSTLDDIISYFVAPPMGDFPKSIIHERNAWFCYNRMGALEDHGKKVLYKLKSELKGQCILLFNINNWMNSDKFLEALAGFIPRSGKPTGASGREVLQVIHDDLPSGTYKDLVRKAIELRLDPKKSTAAAFIVTPSPEQRTVIDKINNAINADPRKGQLSLFYKLPLEMYSPGREIEGGLYFKAENPDPNLSPVGNSGTKELTVYGSAKVNITRMKRAPGSKEESETIVPMVCSFLYEALKEKSDTYIRSVVWHEMVHLRQYAAIRSLRKDQTQDVQDMAEFLYQANGKPVPEMEAEACSEQLAEYFDDLTDVEILSILGYYSSFMSSAIDPWRRNSKDTIIRKIQISKARKKRLLKILDSMDAVDKKNLSDFRKNVNDATVTG